MLQPFIDFWSMDEEIIIVCRGSNFLIKVLTAFQVDVMDCCLLALINEAAQFVHACGKQHFESVSFCRTFE